MNSRHFVGALVLLFALMLGSCNIGDIDGDLELPNHTGKVGLIVGSTTYTIQELLEDLEDSSLVIEEDNSMLLRVIYTDSTGFDDIDEIIVIDDVSNPGRIEPGISIPAPGSPVDQEIEHVENLQFNYPIAEDEELDRIVYSGGTIRLDMESTFGVDIDFRFVIDDITNPSTEDTLIFEGTVGGGSNISQQFSLIGFQTDAELDTINNENIFTGTFEGTLIVNTGDVVNDTDVLNYSITIEDVTFETIFGYFGVKTFDIQQETIEIGFFEGIEPDGLTFKSPEIRLIIENSFGVPMGLDISDISSTNDNGQTVNLTGSITDDPLFIRFPSINEVGNSYLTEWTIDNDNSNLRDLLAISPNRIDINISAESNYNPIEDPREHRNFVDESSVASVIMEMELPLDVRLEGFSRDFDFELDSLDLEDADTVNMRIRSLNLLPFTGLVDLQLINPSQADSILFEIPDILLIESPELPISGRAEEPQETLAIIPFFDESLDALKGATKLNLVMAVDSYDAENETFVKIYSDSSLELIVSLEASLNLEL